MKIHTYQVAEKAGKGKLVEVNIPSGHYIATFRSLNMPVPAGQMKSVLPLPKELMQVSGTGEGRRQLHEYIEKEWVATVSNDSITPQWHFLGYVNPNKNDFDDHQFTHCRYALVADKPFGVICWQNCYYYHWECILDWEDFVVAGRVKGNRITRGADIRRPMFVKSEDETWDKRGWGWTRLSELAQVLGEDPMVVWNFYFHIGIGSSRNALGASEHILHVRCGDKPSDALFGARETDEAWVHEVPTLGYTAYEQFRPCGGWYWKEQPPHKMWVPAGWAMQACYLHHFGFRPPQKQ